LPMLKSLSRDRQGAQNLDGISQIDCRRISELLVSQDMSVQQRCPDRRQQFLFEKGGGCVLIDNEELRLAPGSLLVLPANCPYQFRLTPDTDGFAFSGSELFLRTRVAQAMFTTPSSFWESYYKPYTYDDLTGEHQREKRKRIFTEVSIAAARFGLGCDAAIMAYILVVVVESTLPKLLQGWQPPTKMDSSDTSLLYQYQILVENHFREHLTIESYCQMLGVTRNKLIEVCKQLSELTPLELVHKRMILEAKRELLSSMKTVNEITFDLGFIDYAYFSRFFKNQTGFSPTHFRSLGNKYTA